MSKNKTKISDEGSDLILSYLGTSDADDGSSRKKENIEHHKRGKQTQEDYVLQIKDLHKYYGQGEAQVHALNGISIDVMRGEFLLIVGSSGSGKSSLLNVIGLLDRPSSGTLILGGTEIKGLKDSKISELRNKKLGFIFQFANLLPDLTILENVMLPRQILGDSHAKKTARQDAEKLLDAVGMKEHMNKRANKVSGGQAQRAAVARALVNKPDLVLADEPTGSLDSVTADSVVALMKRMARELKQTFVIVTHEREQFGAVDRIITIKDGYAIEEKEESSNDKITVQQKTREKDQR